MSDFIGRHDEMTGLHARIAELEAERAALLADKERLDWMEALLATWPSCVSFEARIDSPDPSCRIRASVSRDVTGGGCRRQQNVRAAIDAAREQKEGTPCEP